MSRKKFLFSNSYEIEIFDVGGACQIWRCRGKDVSKETTSIEAKQEETLPWLITNY